MANQTNKQKTTAVERIQDINVSVNKAGVELNNKQIANQTDNKLLKEKQAKETGGPKGLEPTRYGDWESKGRCYDF